MPSRGNCWRASTASSCSRPPARAHCCGSAGVYNVLQPDAAADLGRRAAKRLLATGADAIVTANPGCALQVAAYARELGRELPVYHPIELLHRSITTPTGAAPAISGV